MGSLTTCLSKAGKYLPDEDRAAIMDRVTELRAQGVGNAESARQAVSERVAAVAEQKAKVEPKKSEGGKLSAESRNLIGSLVSVLRRSQSGERDGKAVLKKTNEDGLSPRSEGVADLSVSHASGPQENSLFSGPALGAMLAQMRSAVLNDPKVLRAIVGAVPVDVVNNLAGSQSAAEALLRNHPMFKDGSAFNTQLSIAEAVDTTDPVLLLVREVAIKAAETAGMTLDPRLEAAKLSAAEVASERNGLSHDGLSQGPRATFIPSRLEIALNKDADWSSFLHESGHFYLHVMADMASQPNAPAGIAEDMGKVLGWFGVKDLATWNAMSLDDQRKYHERFAESLEQYFLEGKAPSLELQPVFHRMRAWLTQVYKSVKEFIAGHPDSGVELSDEIRQVFDRILASEEEIRQAEEVAGMLPDETATNDAIAALTARSLRDLKWLSGAKSKAIKAIQKQAATARAEIRAQVTAEVEAMPAFQAKDALEAAEKAHDQSPTSAEFNAQMIADAHGFSSIDHMHRAILEAGEKPDYIRRLTDQRMLEAHGELIDPKAIEEAANLAIHNDARAKVLAAELKAQTDALGATVDTGKTNTAGKKITVNALAKAARMFADNVVSRAKIIDLRKLAQNHTAAERRAAKRWMQETSKGATREAVKAKQDQVLNNAAAKAALEAEQDVTRMREYLRKFDREGVRAGLASDYVDQIDKLLERIDLRASPGAKDIERRAKLAAWIKSQEDIGIPVEIPEYLLEDAKLKSYKEMTVEEFTGLVETVKMIEHLGRLKNRLLTAKDNRDYQTIKQEMVESVNANAGERTANTRTSRYPGIDKLKNFAAQHIKSAMFARTLDGGKDGGAMWEHMIRPANEAATMETSMRSQATEALSNILAPWIKANKTGGKGQYFRSVNRSFNRTEVLSIALNIGNESNLQRLLGGEEWTVEQIKPILDTLTPLDKQTVQAVWDYLESRVADIEAVERDVYGKKLKKVERGSPLASQYGLEGGYYPITYDPRASQRAQENADAEQAKADLRGAYGAAQVRKGFTKARAEEVHGRPLLYNLSGLFNGVNDQIHFISWSRWLIDANRLLRSTSLDQAIRGHYGPDMVEQLKEWRNDIANGGKSGGKEAIAASWLRHAVSISAMGFNVMSAAMQPLGLTQSVVRVGPKWIGRGVSKYIQNPVAQTKAVRAQSEFMANRTRTQFRELNELRNQIEGESHLKEFVGKYGYFLMAQVQQMVDIPTWTGAYEKAISEGNDQERAVRLADQAVIDSQGSGLINDLSAIERGNAWKKLFTVFYSFMNTALNLGVTESYSSQPTAAGRAKLAVKMLTLYTLPAVLGMALKDALVPGDSGDDDWEKLARKLIGSQIEYLMGLMVVVREFAEAGRMLAGAGDRPRDYAGPAGVRVVGDVVKLGVQIKQGEFDDAFRKALINVAGDVFGLPSVQTNRTITGIEALNEGKTDNPAAVVFGYQEPR